MSEEYDVPNGILPESAGELVLRYPIYLGYSFTGTLAKRSF